RRVNFDVDRARVGQRTNYDKLIIEIWTDGTIRPEEALSQAAQIMMKHLTVIGGVDYPMYPEGLGGGQYEQEEMEKRENAQLYEKPIEELDLSVRVFNSLKRTGITTVGDVLDMLNRGP